MYNSFNNPFISPAVNARTDIPPVIAFPTVITIAPHPYSYLLTFFPTPNPRWAWGYPSTNNMTVFLPSPTVVTGAPVTWSLTQGSPTVGSLANYTLSINASTGVTTLSFSGGAANVYVTVPVAVTATNASGAHTLSYSLELYPD